MERLHTEVMLCNISIDPIDKSTSFLLPIVLECIELKLYGSSVPPLALSIIEMYEFFAPSF